MRKFPPVLKPAGIFISACSCQFLEMPNFVERRLAISQEIGYSRGKQARLRRAAAHRIGKRRRRFAVLRGGEGPHMKKRLLALLLAFTLCIGLTVPALAATPDADGFIVTADGILTEYRGPGGHIVLPSTVKKIGYAAFDHCASLSSVVIPSGVTYIGTYAFRDCIGLSKVTFPNTLTEIDGFAFAGCISLTNIDLPDSLTTLGAQGNAFSECVNLKRVTLGTGLQKLPYATFGGCSNLSSIAIPRSVTVLDMPFPDCPNLTIHGTAGSAAETYAAKTGIPFSTAAGPSGTTVSLFSDVSPTSPDAAAILWAVEKQITTGKTAEHFAPEEACTIGQLLTFLWRASDSPSSREANPFTDPIPRAYQKAVVWAYEKGLVSGSVLGASAPCTRRMVTLCLWKLAGSPASFSVSFRDIPRGSDDFMAASWAVTTGVVDSSLQTFFSPDTVCTRGQVLSCIYRALAK